MRLTFDVDNNFAKIEKIEERFLVAQIEYKQKSSADAYVELAHCRKLIVARSVKNFDTVRLSVCPLRLRVTNIR